MTKNIITVVLRFVVGISVDVTHLVVAILHFVGHSINILAYDAPFVDWSQVVYFFIHNLSQTIESVGLMRIRDYALLLNDAYARCVRHMKTRSCLAGDDGVFVVDLQISLESFDACFGMHMLLLQINDFLSMTSIGFYLLVEWFVHNDVSLTTMVYMFLWVMPTVAKNVWIVGSVANLQQRVCCMMMFRCNPHNSTYVYLRYCNCKRPLLNCDCSIRMTRRMLLSYICSCT